MNVIKFFHHEKWPYKALAAVCILYALFSFYELVIQNKTPFTIKAEGIVLDQSKKYYFTNYDNVDNLDISDLQSAVLIRYNKNEEWMPNHLGTLYYDSQWRLELNKAIQNPKISKHPFLPYCRSFKKTVAGNFNFFDSGETLSEEQLTTGLIFNYPTGSTGNREYLIIKDKSNKKILYFEDDGVGISYKLPATEAVISTVFNSKINEENTKGNLIFKFNNTSPRTSDVFNIKYTPHSFISASIKVQDESGNTLVEKKHISQAKFQVGNILFSLRVNQKYGIKTIFLFLIHIILIAAFLFFFIGLKPPAYNNPIQSSIVKSRIIMNCLMLVGTALFIKTFGYYTNSIRYDLSLFIAPLAFNSSYFLVPTWKKLSRIKFSSLSKKKLLPERLTSSSKIYNMWMVFFFVIIPIGIAASNIVSNERVMGIPALHFQKILIILAYFVFASKAINNRTKKYFHNVLQGGKPKIILDCIRSLQPKNVLILLFSLALSLATSDYGSILFVALAIVMIELTLRRIKLKNLILVIAVLLGLVLFLNQVGIVEHRKLYRLLYSFFPPDSNSFAHFNQADRESLSYIWFNLQSFMDSFHIGLFNDLKILEVSKSVAHSDYAFHWSLMLGGVPFLLILLICLSFLLTHLFFIFKSTLIPMKVERRTYLGLVNNKYTIIISFWLAITIVQFIYQLFSNNMLFGSVLSGIPFPFISVGRGDFFFLTIVVVGLEILFYSNSFKADLLEERSNAVSSNYLFKNSFKQAQYVLIAFLLLFGLKGIQFWHLDKEEINIAPHTQRAAKEDEIVIDAANFSLENQNGLIKLAQDEITDLDLTNLPIKVKELIKPLQYAYFNSKPIKETLRVPFELRKERLEEIVSWENHFGFRKREISGGHKPFGRVFATKVLVNDSFQSIISHPYYSNLNLNNQYMNFDLSAELNRLLESHIQLISSKAEASILILDNKKNEYVATSQYPNESDSFVYYKNYFIGSAKKPLLLDAALSINFDKYRDFQSNGLNLDNWIKYSNYEYAGNLLTDILQNKFEEFDGYLSKEYNLPFYSIRAASYSDRPKRNLINIRLLANGGIQKYPLPIVLQWYKKIALKAADEEVRVANSLKQILNLPLHTYGTASVVGRKLQQSNIDVSQFIAKTGTLEENGRNISSTFIISNQQYTIGIMMTGKSLPNNSSGLTAKFLFANEVIPLLKKYSILTK